MNGSMQLYMKQPVTGTVVTLSTGQGMTANTRYVCAFACSPTNVKMYMPLSGQWSSTTYTAYDATWGSPQTFHLGFQWGGSDFCYTRCRFTRMSSTTTTKQWSNVPGGWPPGPPTARTLLCEKWAAS